MSNIYRLGRNSHLSEIGQNHSDLVGLIYESALDRDSWPGLLQLLADSMHSKAAVFRVSDVVNDKALTGLSFGHDDSYMKQYREYYIHNDPYRPALKRYPAGKFYPGQVAISYEEVEKHEFFNDMLVRNGMYYTLGGFAMRDHALAYQVIVQRGKEAGDFSQQEIDQFNRLIPHFQRAFKINQHIATIEHHGEIIEASLDQLSIGVLLIDEEGVAFHMNKKAEEIIATQVGVSLVSGRLVASSLSESARLRQIISNAIGRLSDGEMAVGEAMSLMNSAVDMKPLSILVTPLNSRNREQLSFLHRRAAAAVFVGSPSQTRQPNEEVIRMLYGLTEAEARLASALAMGHSLNEICSFYRISIHTARSHLKTVFEKTGCSRQAELVKLILTSSAAL